MFFFYKIHDTEYFPPFLRISDDFLICKLPASKSDKFNFLFFIFIGFMPQSVLNEYVFKGNVPLKCPNL